MRESVQNKTSASDDKLYTGFCQSAAKDDKVFATFRNSPVYQQILEHFDFEYGSKCLELIQTRYTNLVLLLDQFRTSDLYGGPQTYDYPGSGPFSPSTLRYICGAGHLIECFGDLNQCDIVEIGVGYGGLCKILFDCSRIRSYTLIDLPEVLQLARRFLELAAPAALRQIRFCTLDDLDSSARWDLLVSNCALSECVPHVQQTYIDRAISRSKAGFITVNLRPESMHPAVLISEISRVTKHLRAVEEKPLTCPTNFVLIWSDSALTVDTRIPPFRLKQLCYEISPRMFSLLRRINRRIRSRLNEG